MSRTRYAEAARLRLLDAWTGQASFGEAIGCVTTTFTFDSAFFEEQCLARFLKIESDPAEDVRGYLVEREERLAHATAFVLVDDAHVPKLRSLRWHVLPMRVPGGGVFHAKVTLLLWEAHARVLVSSANLTEFGYRRNYEQMAVLDFGPDESVSLEPLRQVLAFLRNAREFVPGADRDTGPQAALALFLAQVDERIARWPSDGWQKGEVKCSFVSGGPGRPDIFEQLAQQSAGASADLAWVMSPFYSPAEDARRTVSALDGLLRQRGERKILFIGRGWKNADGTAVLDMPATLEKPGSPGLSHEFGYVCDVGSGESTGEIRTLHAKSLWIRRSPRALFLVGSSNFTAPGTGIGPVVNVEANVLYDIPDIASPFARICDEAFPPFERVDATTQKVVFRSETGDQTLEPEQYAVLPDAFGGVLFRQIDGRAVLELELLAAPPLGASVLGPTEQEAASGSSWNTQTWPVVVQVPWQEPKPPSFLVVTWPTSEGPRQAIWVVNIADASVLPPPDELKDLALEDLLELLTSARPYHEVLSQIWRRRGSENVGGTAAPQIDPHRRVDTRGFVLQRMKRIAAALEGLKERLERPVFTLDALRWRLHGPLGPLALAKRLAAEEPEGPAFMIAEVALTVHDTELHAPGEIGTVHGPREKRLLLQHLRDLAMALGAPSNLEEYVRRTFSELTS